MPDRKKVMSWLEGLAQQDWRMFHSDSEVQIIAEYTLSLLKEQEETIKRYEHFIGKMMDPDAENQACPPPPKV